MKHKDELIKDQLAKARKYITRAKWAVGKAKNEMGDCRPPILRNEALEDVVQAVDLILSVREGIEGD